MEKVKPINHEKQLKARSSLLISCIFAILMAFMLALNNKAEAQTTLLYENFGTTTSTPPRWTINNTGSGWTMATTGDPLSNAASTHYTSINGIPSSAPSGGSYLDYKNGTVGASGTLTLNNTVLSTYGFTNIQVSWGQLGTTSYNESLGLNYSLNGGTYTSVGAITQPVKNSNLWTASNGGTGTAPNGSSANAISLSGAGQQANLTIQIVGTQTASGSPTGHIDIDDVYITGTPSPFLLPSVASITTTSYAAGQNPSASQSLTVNGYSLTGTPGNLTVTAPSGFLLSINGTTSFGSTGTISYSSSILNSGNTIFVELNASTQGTYSGNMTISGGGASDTYVSLSGVVTAGACTAVGSVATTTEPSGITSTGASSGGSTLLSGGTYCTITTEGVLIGTSANPTLSGSYTHNSSTAASTDPYTESFSGLTPNTQYYINAYVNNGFGNGYANDNVSFWTLANAPGQPVLSLSGSNVNVVSFSTNSNPAPTSYAIQETNSGYFVGDLSGALSNSTTLWQTEANWQNFSITGLNPGTQYTFKVIAINGAGNINASTTVLSALIPPSVVLKYENFGTNSITGTIPFTTGWSNNSDATGWVFTNTSTTSVSGQAPTANYSIPTPSGGCYANFPNGTANSVHYLYYNNNLSTLGYSNLSASWGACATNAFAGSVVLQYSSDGTNWNQAGPVFGSAAMGGTLSNPLTMNNNIWYLANGGNLNDPNAGTLTTFGTSASQINNLQLRFVGTNGATPGGHYAIDDLSIFATPTPTLSLNSTILQTTQTLNGFTYVEQDLGPSIALPITINGFSLTTLINGSITINGSAGNLQYFEVSTDGGSTYNPTGSITITNSVLSKTIYVREIANLLNANSPYSEPIIISASGVSSLTINCNGEVTLGVCTDAGTVATTVDPNSNSSITSISATSGGQGLSVGSYCNVLSKGVCWATTSGPVYGTAYQTSNGTGLSDYTSSITGLLPNVQYFVRSYVNTASGITGYGPEINFYTLPNTPAAMTLSPTGFTTISGTINSNNNPSPTSYAIQETSSGNYVQANGSLSAGSTIWQTASAWGTVLITVPAQGTYHFQVIAANSVGGTSTFGPSAAVTTWIDNTTNPALYDLNSGAFSFTTWSSGSTAGTYPSNIVFQQSNSYNPDPVLSAPMTDDYIGAYNGTSGTRINGENASGFAFINTGTGDNLGAAVLGLNTTSRANILVSYSGATLNTVSGDRICALQLQYRVGTTGTWTNVPGSADFTYPTASANLGPYTLPGECENQAAVYLRWKYYYVSGTTGTRPQLQVGNIFVSSSNATPNLQTYIWNKSGAGAWTTSSNWTPSGTPGVGDLVNFSTYTAVVTSVPTVTLSQITLTQGANITLQGGSASGTITLTGTTGSGNDFYIDGSSSLTINTANALTISLQTGKTGNILGSVTLNAGAHKITATDAGAITFQSGATMTTGATFTGNAFGSAGTAGSVIFYNGSTYTHNAGANPFGLTAPNSIVTFNSNSNYIQNTTAGFSTGQRIFPNLTIQNGIVTGYSTAAPTSINNLTIGSGSAFNITGISTTPVTGNITVSGSLTFISGSTLNLDGTSGTQTLSGSGTISLQNLTIANGQTLPLSQDLTVGGILSNSGNISIGNHTLTLNGSSANASLTGGTSSNIVINSGANTIPAVNLNNLTFNGSTTLTGSVNIYGIVHPASGSLSSSGYLTLISNASQTALISGTGSGNITGTVYEQRYIAGSNPAYHYLSSPFSNADASQLDSYLANSPVWGQEYATYSGGNVSGLWFFNETIKTGYKTGSVNGWIAPASASTVIGTMQGVASYLKPAQTVVLSGNVNSGSLSGTLTYTSSAPNSLNDGFNLVGNPYPSPIDWDASSGWTKTNINNAIYFWNPNLSGGSYSSYVNGFGQNGGTNIIPAMQSFFVQGNSSNPSLGVTNAVRTNVLAPFYFKKGEKSGKTELSLQLTISGNNSSSDQTIIYFDSTASVTYNPNKDARKLFGSVLNLYSIIDSNIYAIKGMPYNIGSKKIIPLGYSVAAAGNYVINANQILNFDPNWNIYLVDSLKGTTQNLLSSALYSFTVPQNTLKSENRFYITFTNATATGISSVKSNENANVFIANNRLTITNVKGNADLFIYDLTGQLVNNPVKINGNSYNLDMNNLAKGCYLVKLINNNSSIIKKVIVD